MDRALELEHLRKADTDIARARERVVRQVLLIERLDSRGRDISIGQSFLDTMRRTLSVMEEHRLLILRELEPDAQPDGSKATSTDLR